MDWLGLLLSLAYIFVLVGSFATFSYLYKSRKANHAAALESWFPQNLQRNIYLSLLHLEPHLSSSDGKTVKVPDSVLKAALLNRATEDIYRLVQIRNAKQPLSTMLQRGSVGDDLWQRHVRAEKEIEAELRDVVQEANAFQEGWGQGIFQSANEMANNILVRKRMEELQGKAYEERLWWEARREQIRTEFEKELDNEGLSEPPTAKSGKSSDDDAVLVERDGLASPLSPLSPTGSTGGKKKKAKK